MIKIKLRKNLLYLLVYCINWDLRKIIDIIIETKYNKKFSYILLYLMTLGEIIGGLSIYLYHYRYLIQKKQIQYFEMPLIYNKTELEIPDSKFKKGVLIFFAAFFDFFEYIIQPIFIIEISQNISPTLGERLGNLTLITSSLLCVYALKVKISKHHKLSLIIMSLCIISEIIIEFIYKPDNINLGRFIFIIFLILIDLISISFTDCIEKYLVDTNFLNPFKIIMFEGIFEFFFSIIFSIGHSPFEGLKEAYENESAGSFTLLIFLFFLYLIFSALVNTYKIYCNVIYSPMAKTLIDYFITPFVNIYYYFEQNDFYENFTFFIICEIINIILNFFSFVYNEYIILFCCGLDHDTKDSIIERSNNSINYTKNVLMNDLSDENSSINTNDL